ncbi:MAG: hypothetical protein FWG79_04775 [Bacteroidales bacterium]|nr:hypothetical protein [Bacteroidales bacterium]
MEIKKQSRKKAGEWLMDVAKYTLTAGIVMTFLGEFGQRWMFYSAGIVIVVLSFIFGFILYNKDVE